MYRVKTSTFLTHLTGCFIFLSLPVLFIAGQAGTDKALATISSIWYWSLFGSFIAIFYFHTYFLFPQLYLKKDFLLYLSIVLLMLTGIYILRPFDRLFTEFSRTPISDMVDERRFPPGMDGEFLPPPPDFRQDNDSIRPIFPRGDRLPMDIGPRSNRFDVVSIFLFLLTMSLSIATQVSARWRTTEKRALQAEADRVQAELAFLKAQINPHFLFNTLNNIYSLAVTKSEHTAASIMKLSNILRYVTDDVQQDYVALSQEIECIRDYIDLQQLRLGKKTFVEFTVSGNTDMHSIAPLVLMTFVENAFKYGISNHQSSSILIDLSVTGKTISFWCQNGLFPRKQAEREGIGIANTTKRLDHLYPNRYKLNITTENNLYSVDLTLDT